MVLGTSEGGEVRWPNRGGPASSPPSWDDEIDDDDSIEVPTEVHNFGPPSDTFTGQHIMTSAQAPSWLAPAGERAGAAASRPESAQASSPPPPPAKLDERALPGARPNVPHPAREMIAELRDVPAATPRSPPRSASDEASAKVAFDVFWWDDGCAALAEREKDYAQLVDDHLGRTRTMGVVDPWWDEPDEDMEEDDPLETDETVSLVLREAAAVPLAEVEHAMMRALEARRRVSAPLRLLTGEVRLGFDPRAALEVYAEAARPLAKSDKALAATLEHVDQLLQSPLGGVADVARGQRARIGTQWRAANRDLPAEFLDESAARILLQRRAFETRDVLDAPHLRTMLVDGDVAVPLYLPEEAGKRVPLFHTFPARVIAELWPRQDERESHPVSLRAIAVARVVE